MSSCCDGPTTEIPPEGAYRRVLVIVLGLNATMFGVEMIAGMFAGSISLQADALDFFADAATYAITLIVLGWGPLWRSRAGLFKGFAMGLFGAWILTKTLLGLGDAQAPNSGIMGAVGLLALAANVASAVLLYRFRGGDSNMNSAWLCSRNDAIGNLAVIAAANGVWMTGTAWPDLAVGAVIAGLALSASVRVIRQAGGELKELTA